MKKNGFTLIELVSVLVLLAIIITLSINVIINSINNSNKRSNEANTALIETAAKEYLLKHENDYNMNNNDITCIRIQDLIDENLLISNITYNNEKINDKVVRVKYINSTYIYKLDETENCLNDETNNE